MRSHAASMIVSALSFALLASSAHAANYTESVNGDLSGNYQAPTIVQLDPGPNLISGTFGLSPIPNVTDLDYFNVVVPSGYQSQLILQDLIAGGSNSFLGVSSGTPFAMPPTSFDPSPLLGWGHIFNNQIGSNILPSLALGNTLPAGSYTFWINETDGSQAWTYGLNFQVTAIPEPASFAILSPALACLGTRRRRKRA